VQQFKKTTPNTNCGHGDCILSPLPLGCIVEYALILGYSASHPWHRLDFTGPIDHVVNWFFYVPNLLVVEFLHRGGQIPTMVIKSLSFLLAVITSIAVLLVWGPGALGQLGPWHEKRLQRMPELGYDIDCHD
jgi:hypothetical protein